MNPALAVVAFIAGVVLVVFSAERLLEGMVGVARATRLAPFVISTLLSGLEAENVAVGIIAGHNGESAIALGTAYGGATFMVCIALGLGAIIAPLRVHLPKDVIALLVIAALMAGLPLAASATPRWAGAVLLIAFAIAVTRIIRRSATHRFVESDEVREAFERHRPLWTSILLTLVGVAVITVGGELVAQGAAGIVTAFGVPALLIGMVITPAAIEAEEIARQVIPVRRGYADVAAGNVIGTVMYFLLFNLGLITLFTPVEVPRLVRLVDWPFLVGVSVLAAGMLARDRVSRANGFALVILGIAYAAIHVIVQ